MSAKNPLPKTVSANLEARLGAYPGLHRAALEDLDIEASRAVSPRRAEPARRGFVRDLKLLFASLGAGNAVVPMGDNAHTTRILSQYAASLRDR